MSSAEDDCLVEFYIYKRRKTRLGKIPVRVASMRVHRSQDESYALFRQFLDKIAEQRLARPS